MSRVVYRWLTLANGSSSLVAFNLMPLLGDYSYPLVMMEPEKSLNDFPSSLSKNSVLAKPKLSAAQLYGLLGENPTEK